MTSDILRTEVGEREVVAAAQAGDVAAFRLLYDHYKDRVNAVAFFSAIDRSQHEDLLQTIFMKVYRALPGFRFESSLGTWIFRIAINECRNVRTRARSASVPLEALMGSGDDIEDRSSQPDENYLTSQRRAIVEQAVAELSPKLREVVILRYIEGLSYDEIARVLACVPGTVASRLHRALVELEAKLHLLRRVL